MRPGERGGDARRRQVAGVSVVIPVRNNIATIDVQLEAIAAQEFSGSFETIISDNGSTDGMRAHVSSHPLSARINLRWIDSSKVEGECHARNAAIAVASYDLIACCDADDQVEPQWLSALARCAPGFDVIGGSLNGETLNDPDVRQWRSVDSGDVLPTCAGYLPYAQGCNTALWRDVWRATGGFDESMIAGGGDIEFCWRAQLSGYSLGYCADAVVAYRYRTTLRSSWQQVTKYGRGEARVVSMYREHLDRNRHLVRNVAVWVAHLTLTCPVWPWAWSRGRIGSWLWTAGGFWGCVTGSVKYRVIHV